MQRPLWTEQKSAQAHHGPGPGGTEQGRRGARRHATAQGHVGQSRAAEERAGTPRPREDRAGPQRSMQARHGPERTEQGCRGARRHAKAQGQAGTGTSLSTIPKSQLFIK